MSTQQNPAVAYRVHYSGRVQGVGFRATAVRIAQRFPVAGWVRNLPDGQVELLVEGPAAEVQRFLDLLGDYFKEEIQSQDVEPQPVQGQFKGFDMRY
jgi:acylphosphatase